MVNELTELKELLNDLYGKDISLDETGVARDNLVGFFETLLKIDERLKKRGDINDKRYDFTV